MTAICFLFHNIFFKCPPMIKNRRSQRVGPVGSPGEGVGAGQRQARGRLHPRPPQGAELMAVPATAGPWEPSDQFSRSNSTKK